MTYSLPPSDLPREMLLDLADAYGIKADVEAVLREKEAQGEFGLRNMTLSKVLCSARRQRKLSVKNLSALSGVPITSLTDYEYRPQKNMRLPRLLALSRALGLPFILLICAAMRSQPDWLPAPGAKPVPRDRTRIR